jgi:hypothetical protein
MDIGSIFLILALLTAVVLFISRPLLEHRPAAGRRKQPGQTLSALLAERDRVIDALQELDFDSTLGKVPAEDYPAQRNALLQQGAEVLRQIDALAPQTPPEGLLVSPTADDALEAAIAARRRARQEKSAGLCPGCGKTVQKSDRFCPKCGRALPARDEK